MGCLAQSHLGLCFNTLKIDNGLMSVMEDQRVMTSGEIAFDLPSVVEEHNLNLQRDDTA